jgi:hypothetical protein
MPVEKTMARVEGGVEDIEVGRMMLFDLLRGMVGERA